MRKLSEFSHNHHPYGVKMLVKYIRRGISVINSSIFSRINIRTIQAEMDINSYLPQVENYLTRIDLSMLLGWQSAVSPGIFPLAQGEYNMNYLLSQGNHQWVLRVNTGSQIQREDPIFSEFNTVKLFEGCGDAPKPYYLDDSKSYLEHVFL